MTVIEKKVVELVYELRISAENGELVEKVENDKPLRFVSGIGNMLPKFEENIIGLKVGDEFNFKLACKDAYGAKQDNLIVDLHKDVFKINGRFDEELLQVNNVIPMVDQEGRHMNGKVLEVYENNVKLDFNHPLVNQDLYFKGSVIGIREATEEELAHGHVHCNDGCEDNHNHDCGCEHGCGCD